MIGLISYLVLGSSMVLFPETLAKLLLNGQQPIELAVKFLRISGSMFFTLNFLFIYRSTVQGMGKPFIPMCSGLLEMGMRILVIMLFIHRIGFEATAYAEVVAWIGAFGLNFVAYLTVMRKKQTETSL